MSHSNNTAFTRMLADEHSGNRLPTKRQRKAERRHRRRVKRQKIRQSEDYKLKRLRKRLEWCDWYPLYLQSQHWASVREMSLKVHGNRCSSCLSKKRLEIHHLNYRCLFHETPDDVIVLCRICHSEHHGHYFGMRKRENNELNAMFRRIVG